MTVFWSLMIPFLGTSLGAACVFLVKKDLKPLVQKGFLGFASGVMVAASVWSLLIPAMEMSQRMKKFAFVPAAAGFCWVSDFCFSWTVQFLIFIWEVRRQKDQKCS